MCLKITKVLFFCYTITLLKYNCDFIVHSLSIVYGILVVNNH